MTTHRTSETHAPNAGHLSDINGVRISWHSTVDLQAVRTDDGVERLYLKGREVKLDMRKHYTPTQQVINFCSCETKQERLNYLNLLLQLTK